MEFVQGVIYYCCYMDFYGCNGKNVWFMICMVLKYSDIWWKKIEVWQVFILENFCLLDWFKMFFFNELYLLIQGGILWIVVMENDLVGQFGVCECMDYCWYESLDVWFYGFFGLLMYWFKLEQVVMLVFV